MVQDGWESTIGDITPLEDEKKGGLWESNSSIAKY
jgi:hypothetical protein